MDQGRTCAERVIASIRFHREIIPPEFEKERWLAVFSGFNMTGHFLVIPLYELYAGVDMHAP